MKRLLPALGITLALTAAQASADILFHIPDATLDDGATLTGTFTTNDTVNSLLDYDLTTAGGSATGFEYTPLTSQSSSTSLPSIIVVETPTLDHILQVTFNGGLTATGAPITIGQFDSFEQVGAVHRNITAGSATLAATPTPEPSTLALLAIAAFGLVSLGRRRHG